MSASDQSLPRMMPNLGKILEAVLFLVEEAERRGLPLTQYDIVKSIFLADKRHLDEFGRPVTFDNYVAMLHGPVPSATYDMLKPTFDWRRSLQLPSAPWIRTPRNDGSTAANYSGARRSANLKSLSESDVNALRNALSLVKSLSFTGLRSYTHQNKAYVAAWQENEEQKAFDMDYRLIPDFEDSDLISDLEFASKHAG